LIRPPLKKINTGISPEPDFRIISDALQKIKSQ
jgi:hypothetical protein